MTARLVAGLLVTVVALAVSLYRIQWLGRLVWAGRDIPPERRPSLAGAIKAQVTDVFAQRKLFKRPLSGWAHAFTFWAFVGLLATIIEAFGALFQRDFAIPVIGRSAALGFIEIAAPTLGGTAMLDGVRGLGRQAPLLGGTLARFQALGRLFVQLLSYRRGAAHFGQALHDDNTLHIALAQRHDVTWLHIAGGLHFLAVHLDTAAHDLVHGERARLVEARRPQPLVDPLPVHSS